MGDSPVLNAAQVPVLIFAYRRVEHLRSVLESLDGQGIQTLIIYADAAKTSRDLEAVGKTRNLLALFSKSTSMKVKLILRESNLGLGRSLRAGITDALSSYPAAVVLEDDIVLEPGAYRYFLEALNRYSADAKVTSISGWSHPDLVPSGLSTDTFFTRRPSSWGWALYRRSWFNMDRPARTAYAACEEKGENPLEYGADISEIFEKDDAEKVWAARFMLWQYSIGGLSLWPKRPFTKNIGDDGSGENMAGSGLQAGPSHARAAPEKFTWPAESVPNEAAKYLFRIFYGGCVCIVCRESSIAHRIAETGPRFLYRCRRCSLVFRPPRVREASEGIASRNLKEDDGFWKTDLPFESLHFLSDPGSFFDRFDASDRKSLVIRVPNPPVPNAPVLKENAVSQWYPRTFEVIAEDRRYVPPRFAADTPTLKEANRIFSSFRSDLNRRQARRWRILEKTLDFPFAKFIFRWLKIYRCFPGETLNVEIQR